MGLCQLMAEESTTKLYLLRLEVPSKTCSAVEGAEAEELK